MKKNIIVVGCGFVGLSNALLLSKYNYVTAIDINVSKINQLKKKIIPFNDNLMEDYIKKTDLLLGFDTDLKQNLQNVDYVIISTPTDYDHVSNYFNTSSVEKVLYDLNKEKFKGTAVIKSTIPIGFSKMMAQEYPELNILFSPEFLKETTALEDNIYPDRIIVGGKKEQLKEAQLFGEILKENTKNEPDILLTNTDEAEAIKLFSNTYLAMRVAFFNELDTFAMSRNLDTKHIIDGVSKDKRIGEHYNNPSFGYGGYCLPKDTKQLLANYSDIPNELVEAIVKSNGTRKLNIVEHITEQVGKTKTIGVHRLVMKEGSDNFRSSSILGIIRRLKEKGYQITIYEPEIKDKEFMNCKIETDLDVFKDNCDLIVCNRIVEDLEDVIDKIYTRDVYHLDK